MSAPEPPATAPPSPRQTLRQHDARFDGIDARFDGIDARLAEILELLRRGGPAS